MANYFWIMIGGAIGTGARYFINGVVSQLVGETFPWGTIFINVTGSFVIGFFGTLTGPNGRYFASSTARQFVMTGICGGYTTFSSFSLQTHNLMTDGEWLYAGGNVVLSVVLCLAATWIGIVLASAINTMEWA